MPGSGCIANTSSSSGKPQMGSSCDSLPRRYLTSHLPSTSITYVQHRHVLGSYGQGSPRHILFRGSASDFDQVQVHVYLVHIHVYRHDCAGRCRTAWCIGTVSLAYQLLYCYLAASHRRCQPLSVAHRVEPRFDVVHMVDVMRGALFAGTSWPGVLTWEDNFEHEDTTH
jgi:hypothetical protein